MFCRWSPWRHVRGFRFINWVIFLRAPFDPRYLIKPSICFQTKPRICCFLYSHSHDLKDNLKKRSCDEKAPCAWQLLCADAACTYRLLTQCLLSGCSCHRSRKVAAFTTCAGSHPPTDRGPSDNRVQPNSAIGGQHNREAPLLWRSSADATSALRLWSEVRPGAGWRRTRGGRSEDKYVTCCKRRS